MYMPPFEWLIQTLKDNPELVVSRDQIAEQEKLLTLVRKQAEFTRCIALLIDFVYTYVEPENPDVSYMLTFGDAFRDPRVHGEFGKKLICQKPDCRHSARVAAGNVGTRNQSNLSYTSRNSMHKARLAVDFNLMRVTPQGIAYVPESAAHKPFGEFWKTLHPDARWGGDFKSADGNHYSFTHWGAE